MFVTQERGQRGWAVYSVTASARDAGTGGGGGSAAPMGAKVPSQLKGLPWQNSELSEMLCATFFTNLLHKTQEMQSSSFKNSTIAWRRTPSHPYHLINRKYD
jgi:hypothetical protein